MSVRLLPGLHPCHELWSSFSTEKISRAPSVRVTGRVFFNPRGEIILGARASIEGGCRGVAMAAEPGARLLIGEDSHIASGVILYASALIQVGRRCRIGKNVVMLDRKVPIGPPRCRLFLPKPIVILDDVIIGDRVMIMPGITIGWGCVIAPGTLVTQDLPPLTRLGAPTETRPSGLPWFAAPGRWIPPQATFEKPETSSLPPPDFLRLVD